MMIPPLPVEIISDILDLATSPYHTVSAYEDDQTLLRRCCLASKQFRDIAQLMLWSVFPVKRDNANISTLSSFSHLANHIRVLSFAHLGPGGNKVFAAVEALPNVMEVRISGGDKITKEQAASMRYLEHLVLVETSMPSCSPITFVNLAFLIFSNVRSNRKTRNTLFPNASFPALRALYAYGDFYDYEKRQWIFPEPLNLPSGQLDCYQVHLDDLTRLPPDLHSRQVPLLLSFAWYQAGRLVNPKCATFQHFQMGAVPAETEENVDLDAVLQLVKTNSVVNSCSLPINLSPSRSLPPPKRQSRDELLRICKKRKVVVIWGHYSKTNEDDIGVSREFWDYAKELKRKQEAGTAGAQ